MKKVSFVRILDSPVLLVCLLLATSVLAIAWCKAESAITPPRIPGYDWSKHPNALLVSYPPEACGSCGISPSTWILAGIAHNLDVVVISSRDNHDLDVLKKAQLSQPRLHIVTDVSQDIIKRFSPHAKIAAVRVRNGRIARQMEGEMPPESFFR